MYILNWRGHINLRIIRDSTRLVPPKKKYLVHTQLGYVFFFPHASWGDLHLLDFVGPVPLFIRCGLRKPCHKAFLQRLSPLERTCRRGQCSRVNSELKWGASWSYQAIEWGSQTHEYLMNISIVCEKNISFDWRTHPNLSHILQKMSEMTVHSGKKRAIARISSWLNLCVAGGTAISSSSLVYVALRRNWSCPATISGWPGDNSGHRPLIPPGCWRS